MRPNACFQEEVKPVIFWRLRIFDGSTSFSGSFLHAASSDLGKRLVLVKRFASRPLDVLEILDRHLGRWNRDLDTVKLVQMNLAVLKVNKFRLDLERTGSIGPDPDSCSIWLWKLVSCAQVHI